MTIGSGLSASLGWSAESVYGTYVAPAKWGEFNSEGLKLNKKIIANEGLRGGARVGRVSRRVLTTKDAGGDINLDVSSRGFGLLLSNMLGTTTPAATQIGTTTVYRQIHTIGNGYETRSMTLQVGRPQSDGTIKPFTYTGCKFTDFELSCGIDQYLNLKASVDARNETTAQSLVTPTYVTTNEEMFHFGLIDIEIGGTASTASGLMTTTGGTDVAGCKGFTFKHSVPLKTDRYFAGASSLKAAPIENGMRDITGSLTAEFANQAQLYDVMAAETTVAIKIRFTGTVAVGTGVGAFEILMPACKLDAGGPNVDGPDVLDATVNFKAYDDGTNAPVQILYESADTTVL